ncbi:MAG: cation transporter [Verrucomicrobia bacterium]|nr:MAG: cation transporter [Verrucomicrobiota bacterium]
MSVNNPSRSPRLWGLGTIARRLADTTDFAQPEARKRLGMFQGWLSVGFSLVLALTKAVLAWLSGSIALLADALNNTADIASSTVIALSFSWSRRPRDRGHPFGHGRIEHVATLVLSMALLAVGFDVGRAGVQRLLHPRPLEISQLVLAILLVTVLIKTWLALFTRALARATRSETLAADAWNHIFDILSTALVFLGLLGARHGWPALDGWAGLGVAGFIFFTGARYARRSVSVLLGEAPDPTLVRRIQQIARTQPGVQSAHEVVINTYGDSLMVSLHIEVDAAQSAREVHDLAELVERRIEQEIPDSKVIVHVDPVDRTHPAYAAAEQTLRDFCATEPRVEEFHDLRLDATPQGLELSVDVVQKLNLPPADARHIEERLEQQLRAHIAALRRVTLRRETSYSSPMA